MSSIHIVMHPKDEAQIEAVIAFMKALKIKFEISDEKGTTLTPEQKSAIDDAILSIDTVGTTEHDMVMEETQKRYPHLFNR